MEWTRLLSLLLWSWLCKLVEVLRVHFDIVRMDVRASNCVVAGIAVCTRLWKSSTRKCSRLPLVMVPQIWAPVHTWTFAFALRTLIQFRKPLHHTSDHCNQGNHEGDDCTEAHREKPSFGTRRGGSLVRNMSQNTESEARGNAAESETEKIEDKSDVQALLPNLSFGEFIFTLAACPNPHADRHRQGYESEG